jgi:hypothetical protein
VLTFQRNLLSTFKVTTLWQQIVRNVRTYLVTYTASHPRRRYLHSHSRATSHCDITVTSSFLQLPYFFPVSFNCFSCSSLKFYKRVLPKAELHSLPCLPLMLLLTATPRDTLRIHICKGKVKVKIQALLHLSATP